jgi:hypothetical protein
MNKPTSLFRGMQAKADTLAAFDEIINCTNCAAFRHTAEGKPEGLCHRHPPQVVVVPMSVQTTSMPQQYKIGSSLPPVVETGGCFDFLPKPEIVALLAERQAATQQTNS